MRRRVWRWVTDWRNGATLAATLLMVVLLLVVNDAIAGRRQAFDALKRQTAQAIDARRAATSRIDKLQARIDDLVGKGEVNAQVLGQLVAEVEALRTQVRAMGGDPIVAQASTEPSPTTTRQAGSPPSSSPAAPPSTTTTTARPSPSTTTTTVRPGPQCQILQLLCTQRKGTP